MVKSASESESAETNAKPFRVTDKLWVIATSIVLILVVVGLVIVLYVRNALLPLESTGQAVRISIPSGSVPSQIARILEDNQLIRDARVFTYYLKYKKQGNLFKAGQYSMTPGITITEIIDKLNRGDVIPLDVIRITIPEGYTIPQMIEELTTKHPTWQADVFADEVEHPERYTLLLLADLPDNSAIKHRLEGYLFPDTYEFPLNTTENQVITRLLQEMERKLASLPADWQDVMKARNINFHQLLTIASLIEREVVVDDERPIVASVIYNRLAINMALQIDATVQYALDQPKARLLYEDLKVKSPYNTYLYPGLPPGPIAGPSLESIRAALYPVDTEYFYYVTKKDGTSAHLFAETYNQHLKNIKISEKNSN
jgi:UPF0755 protein